MDGRRQSMGAWTTPTAQSGEQLPNTIPLLRSPPSAAAYDDRLRGATNDLFELLERVQCSRLDDQRCMLPAYFSQVGSIFNYHHRGPLAPTHFGLRHRVRNASTSDQPKFNGIRSEAGRRLASSFASGGGSDARRPRSRMTTRLCIRSRPNRFRKHRGQCDACQIDDEDDNC